MYRYFLSSVAAKPLSGVNFNTHGGRSGIGFSLFSTCSLHHPQDQWHNPHGYMPSMVAALWPKGISMPLPPPVSPR